MDIAQESVRWDYIIKMIFGANPAFAYNGYWKVKKNRLDDRGDVFFITWMLN